VLTVAPGTATTTATAVSGAADAPALGVHAGTVVTAATGDGSVSEPPDTPGAGAVLDADADAGVAVDDPDGDAAGPATVDATADAVTDADPDTVDAGTAAVAATVDGVTVAFVDVTGRSAPTNATWDKLADVVKVQLRVPVAPVEDRTSSARAHARPTLPAEYSATIVIPDGSAGSRDDESKT
jgi:hypothetical protein